MAAIHRPCTENHVAEMAGIFGEIGGTWIFGYYYLCRSFAHNMARAGVDKSFSVSR
jgi:hypothetical protein